MDRIPWSEDEAQILQALAKAGKNKAQICTVLKSRTRKAIEQKAIDLGVSLCHGVPEIDHEAFKKIMGESWKQQG